jgi:hypothetical protein
MAAADKSRWRVVGWDTFASEEYPVSKHATEVEAKEAARQFLRDVEREQPSASSGGQSGIQDQVFIIGPDKIRYRFQ